MVKKEHVTELRADVLNSNTQMSFSLITIFAVVTVFIFSFSFVEFFTTNGDAVISVSKFAKVSLPFYELKIPKGLPFSSNSMCLQHRCSVYATQPYICQRRSRD